MLLHLSQPVFTKIAGFKKCFLNYNEVGAAAFKTSLFIFTLVLILLSFTLCKRLCRHYYHYNYFNYLCIVVTARATFVLVSSFPQSECKYTYCERKWHMPIYFHGIHLTKNYCKHQQISNTESHQPEFRSSNIRKNILTKFLI